MSFPIKAQTKEPVQKVIPQKQITDSTAVLSLRDLKEFNEWLQATYSHAVYKTFTPEIVISELWNWKIKQINTKP